MAGVTIYSRLCSLNKIFYGPPLIPCSTTQWFSTFIWELNRKPLPKPKPLLPPEEEEVQVDRSVRRISRGIKLYMDSVRSNEEVLKKETKDFETGKRHLANMMGLDPESLTQEDIDKAIKYLLPSSLSSPRAVPLMKPPRDLFVKQKEIQFAADGRPHSYLFYTTKPEFYSILHPGLSVRLSSCNSLASRRRFYSTTPQGSVSQVKIAIIGAGPAGFYVASSLLKGLPCSHVSIFEKLPVPYGLIRYGVAPDHPEVKNCINQFEQTVNNFSQRFSFFGNVEISKDLTLKEIVNAYHITVLAYGSQKEKHLSIPGANPWATKNYYSARTFVNWYNGFPNSVECLPDLSSVETAVILGQGNVALDVARIVLLPIDVLRKTDITERSLEVLSKSKVKKVVLVGRRGPLHVAFTIKELRELINLPNAEVSLDASDFAKIMSEDVIKQLSRPRQRLTQLLLDTLLAKNSAQQPLGTKNADSRVWSLKFLRSPKEILLKDNAVSGVRCSLNTLRPALNECSQLTDFLNAVAIEKEPAEFETIQCELAISSIGYQTVNIDPAGEVIRFNDKQAVVATQSDGQVEGLGNVFAVGWCARGAVGVLATTQSHASFVAKNIINKVTVEKSIPVDEHNGGEEEISSLLKGRHVPYVAWTDWSEIDSVEKSRGFLIGKPREKLVKVDDIMNVIHHK